MAVSAPMRGKVCLITGATRGLGLGTATALAKLGAHVVIVGRDPQRIRAAMQTLREQAPEGSTDSILADLSSLDQVRDMVSQFQQRYAGLDVLVNNVGGTFLKFQQTVDGFEMTWALNYLSQYLTTRLLLEQLGHAAEKHGEARILGITSSMYRLFKPDFEKLPTQHRFNGVKAYALSKRAMMVFNTDLALRCVGTGISTNVMTPGLVATGVAVNNQSWAVVAMRILHFIATPLDQGVLPIVRLASAPEMRGVSGAYFVKYRRITNDPSCCDPAIQKQLWRMSSVMTGLPE